MKNRYKQFEWFNDYILQLIPAHPTQRHILALEVQQYSLAHSDRVLRMIDLGCGAADLTKYVMARLASVAPQTEMTLVDLSDYMISGALAALRTANLPIKANVYTEDAFRWMEQAEEQYDCIMFEASSKGVLIAPGGALSRLFWWKNLCSFRFGIWICGWWSRICARVLIPPRVAPPRMKSGCFNRLLPFLLQN